MHPRHIGASIELQDALARIAKLEEELNDRDKQLEAAITDHDKDIVDLRKSYEVDGLRKPPLHPSSGVLFNSHDQTRWSMDSVRLSGDENAAGGSPCQECVKMKKQLRQYQRQWKEMSKHFRQVPVLLEGMIQRTDTLVNNITNSK